MPITFTGWATRRLEILVQKTGTEGCRLLAEQLADVMIEELSTIPANWEGNIKRGLLARSEGKPTNTGGWVIGIGDPTILHHKAAPPKTIRQFLDWFRREHKPERAQRRAEARRERRMEKALVKRTQARPVKLFGMYRSIIGAERRLSAAISDRDKFERRLSELIRQGATKMAEISEERAKMNRAEMRIAKIKSYLAEQRKKARDLGGKSIYLED